MMPSSPPLLFSIDVEEFYPADPDRDPRSSPLPSLVGAYLDLLRQHNVRATFFVVGDVARRHPEVLRSIVADGHELACHGDRHVTLDHFTPDEFAADLRLNRAAVQAAAGAEVAGFRAPVLSLTERTSWAYDVLASEGFKYSSSVLPASNPLYGWPSFGPPPRRQRGVVEIPITLASVFKRAVPAFSGTYFRVMPWALVRRELRVLPSDRPVVCYFHPYDIDHRQPWTMHVGVRGSHFMNALLFARRRSLLVRIASLVGEMPAAETYSDYVARQPW